MGADFEKFDIIYALATDVYDEIAYLIKDAEKMQKVKLLLSEMYPNERKSVKDPYYGVKKDYEEVFALLNEVCEVIIEKYR